METTKEINGAMYGIVGKANTDKLTKRYGDSPNQFHDDMKSDPYAVMMRLLGMGFSYADQIIMGKHIVPADARCRCSWAAYDVLKSNESMGNTRMTDKQLAADVNNLCPEAVGHIVDVVCNDARIYYDKAQHWVSLRGTYDAEMNIANNIKSRLENQEPLNIDVEKYKNCGGVELTDEQFDAIKMVANNSVCMINGPAGCVDCDTEFFTGHGWKRIADYESGDKVLQYNKDGTAELVEPLTYIKQPADYLWHFETPHSINQTVCEQHRILYVWKNSNSAIKETNVLELKRKSDENINFNGQFITQFRRFGDGMDLSDEEIRVMVAVMADGRYSTWRNNRSKSTHCRIRLKKSKKINRLPLLLKSAGIDYTVAVDKYGVTEFKFYAPERRKIYGGNWWGVNEHQAKIICEEVVNWDGGTIKSRVHGKEKPCFRTTEKDSADYIQYIFNICGWQSTISVSEKDKLKKEQWKPMYTVTTKHNITSGLCFDTRVDKKKTEFARVPTTDGYKYCFTVPSHMLVLRRKNCIFVTGNCGKSQTTKAIVNMLEDAGKSYALLTPTGISSKVLSKYTGRPSSTIHMFLTNVWAPDYALIDETSICSVHLLSALFNAVSQSTRFIFIADSAQLASIQCGNVVQDMLDSTVVPHVTLSRIFRYNTSGIATIATDMRNGKSTNLLGEFEDYRFIQTNADPIAQTITVYDELRASGYSEDDIVILSPFNKRVGADAINAVISNKYNPGKPVRANSIFKIGDKVINTKNKYEADGLVANGDVGHLVNVWYDRKHKVNHVDVQFGGVTHNVGNLARLKQAWAVSIHKAQGSSARVVILLLDKSHEFFLSRNLMYVGVTRARERLIIIGDISAIEYGLTIIQNEIRNTWLKEFLVDNGTTI